MPIKDADKRREYQRKYRSKHADEIREYQRRYYLDNLKISPEYAAYKERKYNTAYHRARRTGWTPAAVEDALAAQQGCCAICGDLLVPHRKPSGIAADHCHESGKPRGILCQLCNSGLGYFKDSTFALKSAVEYLERHNGSVD